MDDIGPDNIDANQDPKMAAFDVSPVVLSLEAAAIMGMCATVVIGNGFVCVLGYRKPSHPGSSLANTILIFMSVVSLFTTLLTMPLMVAAILEYRWRFGDSLCRGTGTLTFGFVTLMSILVFFIFMNRCCGLCCTRERESYGRKRAWLVLVFFFLIGSLSGLFFLIDWRVFLQNPTRLFCRLANSPALMSYRIFYGLFSVLLSIVIMILLSQSRTKHDAVS